MSTALLGAISVGRVIDGRFPLLQELGRTEWSSAYLTEFDDGRSQKVAIKIFPFASVQATATLARWDVARTLSHPHLMTLLYAGRCTVDGEDLLYVVTEYADEILSQVLPERPLSLKEAREMLGPLLEALSYLHRCSLTHGHLRPTNIMVVNDQLKLSPDFGWCCRTRNIYDPPEAGVGNADPAADIWSLGILLVEALTQQQPVWDMSQAGDPEIPAAIPEPFFTICRECLRIDPERRCTLAGIKARLNPAQPAQHGFHPAEPLVEPTARPSHGPRSWLLIGALLVLLFVVAAFKFGWELTPSSPAPASEPQLQQPAAAPSPPALTAPDPSAAPAVVPSPPAQTAPDPSAASTAVPSPAAAAPAQAAASGIVKGSVTYQALPNIPENILGTIQGHVNVRIRVEVDPEGNVSQAAIDLPGPSRYFAGQALQAAQNWKFTPAQVDGHAAASTWLLRFQFGQTQTVATPSEEFP